MRSSLIAFAAMVVVSSARGQCQYSVETIPPFNCSGWQTKTYTAYGMNDLGAWCGYRGACGGSSSYLPVLHLPEGTPQVLPMPPSAGTAGAQAGDVNNAGVVVGWYRGEPWAYDFACLWWPDGTVVELPKPRGCYSSTADAINDDNIVVGTMYLDSGASILPFIWKDGDLSLISSPDFDLGYARDISNSGYITGEFGSAHLNQARAYRWKDGDLQILEPLDGYPASLGRAVTNGGMVVGFSSIYLGTGVGYMHAPTVWIDGVPSTLPLPPGYPHGSCIAVNDSGVIIGYAQPGTATVTNSIRVIWIDGKVYLLSSLLPQGASVGTFVDVNEAGQILASGPKLLTPISSSIVDLDGDCIIDGDDLGVLFSSWGAPDFDPRCDFNGDGVVNGDDLGTLLGEWTAIK